MARSVPPAVAGAWQYWAACQIPASDGIPCGRPAAAWPSGWARRRCLFHGGRNGYFKAGRNPWAVARITGPKGPRPRLRESARERLREKKAEREREREQRAAERESAREQRAAARACMAPRKRKRNRERERERRRERRREQRAAAREQREAARPLGGAL